MRCSIKAETNRRSGRGRHAAFVVARAMARKGLAPHDRLPRRARCSHRFARRYGPQLDEKLPVLIDALVGGTVIADLSEPPDE
jgi:hypothetical protein